MLPSDIQNLTEDTSVALAEEIQFTEVSTPLAAQPIPTSYVCQGSGPPLLLLHGFDSSLFEFRRLVPRLAEHFQVWVVDLLGFGFTDRRVVSTYSPGAIKLHLHSFWQQMIGQPVGLGGASMGGAAAIDFGLTYPEAVSKLVLFDSAGFAAGPAMG
ncbi:MAG: alpha/beta fold hydrolase, partial [Cyanobacteria bacterium P01_F01_bin.4]